MQPLKAVVRNGRLIVDEPTALPEGTEVELIVRDAINGGELARKLSVDELLSARLVPPPGVGSVSLSDIEKAIADGAVGRGSV